MTSRYACKRGTRTWALPLQLARRTAESVLICFIPIFWPFVLLLRYNHFPMLSSGSNVGSQCVLFFLPMYIVSCFLDFSLPAHVRQVKIAVWLDWLCAPTREMVKYPVVCGRGASFLLKCFVLGSDRKWCFCVGSFYCFSSPALWGGCMVTYEGLKVLCQQ